MSIIQVKGINDYLLFMLNDEVDEDLLLEKIGILTSSPSFKKNNFYTKGYFDFGNREITYSLFLKLMDVLSKSQSVIFCGLKEPKNIEKTLLNVHMNIRNGEIIIQKEDCLFDGQINPGGKLIVYGNLYLLGRCQGEIELIGNDVECSLSKAKDATIIINGYRIDHLNIDELSVFYLENENILRK